MHFSKTLTMAVLAFAGLAIAYPIKAVSVTAVKRGDDHGVQS